MRGDISAANRWCRCARPPATCWDAFGIRMGCTGRHAMGRYGLGNRQPAVADSGGPWPAHPMVGRSANIYRDRNPGRSGLWPRFQRFTWICPGDVLAGSGRCCRRTGSAGFFALWTWVHSATDPNGIARRVTSTGGESPAVTQRRGDMGRLGQMNEWVDHQGKGPSCHPAPREGLMAYKTNICVHRRSSAVKKPRSAIGLRLNRRFHRGTQMILGWGEDGFGGGCHAEARGARGRALR